MKKRIILLSGIVLLLSIITIIVSMQVYAYEEKNILNGRKITSPSELYEEVNANARNIMNNNEICNIANNYIEKIASNVADFEGQTKKCCTCCC